MGRKIDLWTWDRGSRAVDVDGELWVIVPVVQTILDGGLWTEFRKIPADALARVLSELQLEPETRRLVEIWIEEKRQRPAA